MKYFTLLLLILPLFTGCFDSQPPQGVTGQLVGCFDTNNATFCITEYAKTAETSEMSTTPATSVNFSDIIADVAAGNTTYLDQTVTFTAEVDLNLSLGRFGTTPTAGITLVTGDDNVDFFIADYSRPPNLSLFTDYVEGNTYTFTVQIDSIKWSTSTIGKRNVFSVFA